MTIQRILGWTLRGQGYDVRLAGTGQAALSSLGERAPDAIILDLALPDIDGREVFRRLRERGVRAPVLILSAFEARRAQRELGAEAALSKPFDPEDLIAHVDELVDSSRRS